jgi:hypothetical protein
MTALIIAVGSTRRFLGMINLHERYGHYMHNERLVLEDAGEPIVAYGWCDNGKSLTGYYVLTTTKKLLYDLKGKLLSIEDREEVPSDMEVFAR